MLSKKNKKTDNHHNMVLFCFDKSRVNLHSPIIFITTNFKANTYKNYNYLILLPA